MAAARCAPSEVLRTYHQVSRFRLNSGRASFGNWNLAIVTSPLGSEPAAIVEYTLAVKLLKAWASVLHRCSIKCTSVLLWKTRGQSRTTFNADLAHTSSLLSIPTAKLWLSGDVVVSGTLVRYYVDIQQNAGLDIEFANHHVNNRLVSSLFWRIPKAKPIG